MRSTPSVEAQAQGGPQEVPILVPARRRDALVAVFVDLIVLGLLGLYLLWLLERWPPEAVPTRVIYAAIGVGTMFAMLLFLLSLVAYALPRLLGLRRGGVEAGKT